jgi:uncharacterized protein
MTDTISIKALSIYPIKSCSPVELHEARCLKYGFANDRGWAITDASGKLLTQRDDPRLALIKPTVTAEANLVLNTDNRQQLTVLPAPTETRRRKISIWGDEREATEESSEASTWISQFLGYQCHLFRRLGLPRGSSAAAAQEAGTEPPLLFTDSRPVLVVSEESLNDLNERLKNPIGMDRFRAALVIAGLKKYDEDHLLELKGTNVILTAANPCARCVIINIDQTAGKLTGKEPLQTLASYRTVNGKVLFGRYFRVTRPGSIALNEVLNCEFTTAAR